LRRAFEAVARLAAPGAQSDEAAARFAPVGTWVHLFSK
jgi:hypothetical protein